MIKKINKKVIYIGVLSLTIVLGVGLFIINHNSDLSSDIQSNSKSEHKTFEQLKAECDQNYDQDIKKGIRYITYPCEDRIIQEQYEKQ